MRPDPIQATELPRSNTPEAATRLRWLLKWEYLRMLLTPIPGKTPAIE